jgi:SpoU rRNA methylase family enzyme
VLSDLKQAVDNLSPDIVFMLFEEGRGKEDVRTACNIILGAEVLFYDMH